MEYNEELRAWKNHNGDVAGSIVFLNKNTERKFGETEQKMIAVAASFLGKQMEG